MSRSWARQPSPSDPSIASAGPGVWWGAGTAGPGSGGARGPPPGAGSRAMNGRPLAVVSVGRRKDRRKDRVALAGPPPAERGPQLSNPGRACAARRWVRGAGVVGRGVARTSRACAHSAPGRLRSGNLQRRTVRTDDNRGWGGGGSPASSGLTTKRHRPGWALHRDARPRQVDTQSPITPPY